MCKNLYKTSFFTLQVAQTNKLSIISMQLATDRVTTKALPLTFKFLKEYFPSVLFTQCFNDKNLPFYKEVQETELGHLFEHILIEKIKILKTTLGEKNAVVNGNTSWDWHKNPYGFFNIVVDVSKKEKKIFHNGILETIQTMESLLIFHTKNPTGNYYNL